MKVVLTLGCAISNSNKKVISQLHTSIKFNLYLCTLN